MKRYSSSSDCVVKSFSLNPSILIGTSFRSWELDYNYFINFRQNSFFLWINSQAKANGNLFFFERKPIPSIEPQLFHQLLFEKH